MASPDVRLVTETGLKRATDTVVMPLTRGVISTNVNLDTFVTSAHVGSWAGRAEKMSGIPTEIPGTALVNVEVKKSANNAIVQELLSRGERWWRSAVTDGVMDDVWTKIPAPAIVAEDRYVLVPDGEIAYSINLLHSSYDFGNSWPVGLSNSRPGLSGGAWIRNPNLLGGRGVSHELGGVSTILTYDDAGSFGDADILVRGECSTVPASSGSGIVFRAGGSSTNIFEGYQVWVANSTSAGGNVVGLSSRVDGASTILVREPFAALAANKPFMTRINCKGSRIRVKVWNQGTPEPDWMIDVDDTKHASGRVGFFAQTSTFAWDILSVNRGGGEAS